jgi:hypothetical protein
VCISGLFSPLKGYKKVEIGYAVLYFEQGVLPFMFIHRNCKPNVAKMVVLQVTYYVEIISLCSLLNICRLVTLVGFREVYIFVCIPFLYDEYF